MSETKSGRRRKAPKNTEWRGDTLYGRKRLNGQLRRWSLRTGDVELAKTRVAEDIARLEAAAFYGDGRVKYMDVAASWAEQHITHVVSANSAKRYASSLRQLDPILIKVDRGVFPFIELYLDEVNQKETMKQIVDHRRAAGTTTATIKRDLVALSSVLEFAEVDENAALVRSKKLKERRDPIVLPEHAHIQRMIRRAPGRMSAVIETAVRVGCRIEELVTAERNRLDHSRRQLTVIGKGNKLRVIDLDHGAYEILRALPVRLGCKWLFWHGEGEPYRNLSSRFAHLVWGEYEAAQEEAKAAGHAEPDFRRFRFHDLRHRFAVDWLKSGRSIYDLQQQLGHASIKTTELYLKFLTPEEARIAKFGPVGQGNGLAGQQGA